jgi:hypothetical protein
MTFRPLVLIPLAFLGACTPDADGDGLTNGEEKDLGLDKENADTDGDGLSDGDELANGADPLVADSDGDGLLDGEEIANGSDPMVVDTDEDGYTDRDEVFEGHDPADDTDRIYVGDWPYYFEKTELPGGRLENDTFEVGKRYGHVIAKDQYGDLVDLYDFYNSDVPVVIDISAEWCGPCNGLASFLDGGADSYGYGAVWPDAPDAVRRGDIRWITIIGQDMYGALADKATATRWHDAYPTKQIPVLADSDGAIVDFAELGWWPYVMLLTPDLKVDEDAADGSASTVLSVLASRN